MSRPVVHRVEHRSEADYTYCGRRVLATTHWVDRRGFAGVTCKECKRYPKGFTQPALNPRIHAIHALVKELRYEAGYAHTDRHSKLMHRAADVLTSLALRKRSS